MKTYEATARLEERFWVIEVPGVGVTQARNLREVDEMTDDLVVATTGLPSDQFEVTITVDLGLQEDITPRFEEARTLGVEAQKAQAAAAKAMRDVVRDLRTNGVTGRDVAALLGVSEQRVSQLAK